VSIELITTNGIFSLDGEDFDVTNNIWIVGNDKEVVVLDPAHDHVPIVDAVNAAVAFSDITDAPISLHPADRMLWDVVYPNHKPDKAIVPGTAIKVAGLELGVLHTPGHSPGCCCFYDATNGILLSGDTLFCGGPGATGRSHSDYPTIVASIAAKLMGLPDHTVVHTGHGNSTTIGAERAGIREKVAELAANPS
jgi:glyoxylase-like metal-dependent hydrolase (beta-lactamase superfamily II)